MIKAVEREKGMSVPSSIEPPHQNSFSRMFISIWLPRWVIVYYVTIIPQIQNQCFGIRRDFCRFDAYIPEKGGFAAKDQNRY